MYPKLSSRQTADGQPAFSYVCKTKERSRGNACRERNVTGDTLDAAVLRLLRELPFDADAFISHLTQRRRLCTGNPAAYEEILAALRHEKSEAERRLSGLVDSLADLPDSVARSLASQRIEQLQSECAAIDSRIRELTGSGDGSVMSRDAFTRLQQTLSSFPACIAGMTLHQQRSAVREAVQCILWDGETAHVYLRGAESIPPLCEDSK